jgi:release factor glutamine methyltransferase
MLKRPRSTESTSLAECVTAWTHTLAVSSATPRLDAELLACHALHITRAQLIARATEVLEPSCSDALDALCARRAGGEPVAYILGEREFWSLRLKVTPDVLIPRPETELLVELALALLPPDAVTSIADIGTGSGAIALAIASARPGVRMIATDTSEPALAVARANACAHTIANIEFRHGAGCEPIHPDEVSLIVSNPPYVADADPHLACGDLRFEPRSALAGGADGLDVLRQIIAGSTNALIAGGTLMVEHGYDQGESVHALFARHGYREITLHRDLAGLPRVTTGVRHA